MPHPKVKLSDDSGNAVSVTSNRLDVNAYLSATPTIDIGDVSIKSGDGTAITDTVSGRLDVTLDSNSGVHEHSESVPAYGIGMMGESKTIDGSTLPNSVSEGESARIAVSIFGIQYAHLTDATGRESVSAKDDDGQVNEPPMLNVGGEYRASPTTYANGDATILQTNVNGALKVAHHITGGADGVTTVSSAGTDVVLGGDVACKKVDIQAQTDNTGLISVGFTGVDATEATGTGVILYAGDTYSLEINNLQAIYIDSTVSGEGVRYTYFT